MIIINIAVAVLSALVVGFLLYRKQNVAEQEIVRITRQVINKGMAELGMNSQP